MYPFIRLALTILKAGRRPRLCAAEEGRIELRALLGDIDIYPELNNGRHLTLMDLGRLDFTVRTGLFRLLKPNGWALVVAGASVRFRHRIPAFSRFVISSQLVGRDRFWFYFHQKTERQGRICSAALVKTGIASKAGMVPTGKVLSAAGDASLAEEVPNWVAAWSSAEALRPWSDSAEPVS